MAGKSITGRSTAGRPSEKQRIEMFFELLDNSVQQRMSLAKSLQEFIPLWIQGLRDLAEGIWMEKEQEMSDGRILARVYRRSPNMNAVKLLQKYANLETGDIADAFNKVAKAQNSIIQQRVFLQQAKLQEAMEQKTRRETEGMDKAYATEDQFEYMTKTLAAACIGAIQSESPDFFIGGEDGKQRIVTRIGQRLEREAERILMGEDGNDTSVD